MQTRSDTTRVPRSLYSMSNKDSPRAWAMTPRVEVDKQNMPYGTSTLEAPSYITRFDQEYGSATGDAEIDTVIHSRRLLAQQEQQRNNPTVHSETWAFSSVGTIHQ